MEKKWCQNTQQNWSLTSGIRLDHKTAISAYLAMVDNQNLISKAKMRQELFHFSVTLYTKWPR